MGDDMQKLKYKDTFIYVDDSPLDEQETGVMIDNTKDYLEDTIKIKPIDQNDLLEDTNTDIFKENNNEQPN